MELTKRQKVDALMNASPTMTHETACLLLGFDPKDRETSEMYDILYHFDYPKFSGNVSDVGKKQP